jgi:hypothetical protein
MASPQSDRYFLPRFLDAGNVAEAEFVAWISGLRAFLPRRARPRLQPAIVEQLAPTS